MSHASHFVGTAHLLQESDPPGQQSARPGRANSGSHDPLPAR
jgi:hypothetical protein